MSYQKYLDALDSATGIRNRELRHLKNPTFTEEELPKEVLARLESPLLEPYRASIISSARPVAEIKLENSNTLDLWQSKVGGNPYLPKNIKYPQHLEDGYFLDLVIQINFAEMPPIPNYPEKGILQFFVDGRDHNWGFKHAGTPIEHIGYKVIYHPEIIRNNKELVTDFSEYHTKPIYQPFETVCKINFFPNINFLDSSDGFFALKSDDGKIIYELPNGENHEYSQEFSDAYRALNPIDSHISGYNEIAQFDPRNDIYIPESQEELDPLIRLLDYELLIRLENNAETYQKTGGSYTSLYIHPEDLKNKDFSQVMFYHDSN